MPNRPGAQSIAATMDTECPGLSAGRKLAVANPVCRVNITEVELFVPEKTNVAG